LGGIEKKEESVKKTSPTSFASTKLNNDKTTSGVD